KTGVDAVEERRLVLVLLAGDRRVDQLIRRAPLPTTAASALLHARNARQPVRALALVIAARIGANLGVGAAEQLVVSRRVDAGQVSRRSRRSRRRRTAASADDTASAGVIELLRLPRAKPFRDLIRIPGRVTRRLVRL